MMEKKKNRGRKREREEKVDIGKVWKDAIQ